MENGKFYICVSQNVDVMTRNDWGTGVSVMGCRFSNGSNAKPNFPEDQLPLLKDGCYVRFGVSESDGSSRHHDNHIWWCWDRRHIK